MVEGRGQQGLARTSFRREGRPVLTRPGTHSSHRGYPLPRVARFNRPGKAPVPAVARTFPRREGQWIWNRP
jgi:hypothetical protein